MGGRRNNSAGCTIDATIPAVGLSVQSSGDDCTEGTDHDPIVCAADFTGFGRRSIEFQRWIRDAADRGYREHTSASCDDSALHDDGRLRGSCDRSHLGPKHASVFDRQPDQCGAAHLRLQARKRLGCDGLPGGQLQRSRCQRFVLPLTPATSPALSIVRKKVPDVQASGRFVRTLSRNASLEKRG